MSGISEASGVADASEAGDVDATAADVAQPLLALIESGLALPYTSRADGDGSLTSTRYQSIVVGGRAIAGQRDDRAGLLGCIDFRGRTVLDLGSNLGEIARAARTRGARLVDGVEHDPFFVELARLITAANGQSRVSFRQGDIGDPALYRERYDLVLALSALHCIGPALDAIARVTDVLIVETSPLRGNFDGVCLGPLQARFPAVRVLGQTDWGPVGDGVAARLAVACAKDRERLTEVLAAPHAWSLPTATSEPHRSVRAIDPRASTTHDAFFAAWDYATPEELLRAVESSEIPVAALAANRDVQRYPGWAYWFAFLKGWLHHRSTGEAGPGNPYHDLLASSGVLDGIAQRLATALADGEDVEQLARRRFADLDRLHEGGAEAAEEVEPIRAIVGALAQRDAPRLADAAGGAPIATRRIDGWHRLFGARALGAPRLRAELVKEPLMLPLLRGAVEGFALADGVVSASGWALDPDGPLDALELRRGGETLARARPSARADVSTAFPDLAHAADSGFALAGELGSLREEPLRLELVGIRDRLPVGRLRIDVEPGMLRLPAPPPGLLTRVAGHADRARALLATALAANALLDALAPLRLPESFREVVHWDAGCALLLRLAARRLPRAALTSVSADAEAIAWAQANGAPGLLMVEPGPRLPLDGGSMELLLRERPLAMLDANELRAWLAEVQRVLAPGGYAAAIGGWAPERRAAMLEICGNWLTVAGAATAPAWPGGDAIVLRRS